MTKEPESFQFSDLPLAVDEAIEAWSSRGKAPGSDEVERLCREYPQHEKIIRTAASDVTDGAIDGQPRQVGPYRLLRRIGEGGMGTVYLAEQREPVRRRVAIKVVKLGMDSKGVLARFEAERQALALMEHSCIARVLDGGLTERGQPWFAMEFVKGIPITNYCDQAKLSLDSRIDLFRQVCSGVQHAHQKGVMHRDLKPSNVLVTVQDGRPRPKIIDFGLAKAVDHSFAAGTIVTEAGQVIGTPEYMSPEQAGSDGLDIDTRTDVYSLGVLLYELLAGELPFTKRELHGAGLHEMQRLIKEADPPRPSTRVTTLGNAATQLALVRGMVPAELGRVLRGDLDWVVMKALEKDRTRRYDTPLELAADLERYVKHEPVLAARPSAFYRATKFVRRHRLQVIAGVFVAGALVLGSIGTLFGMWKAQNTAELLAAKMRDFDQLATVGLAKQVREHERALPPAWPQNAATYEGFLRDELQRALDLRPLLTRTLGTARARAESASGGSQSAQDRLAREAERYLVASLEGVLSELDALVETGKVVELDLAFARQLQSATTSHPSGKSWEEAARAIAAADGVVASDLYRKVPIRLEPQPGLVPIGMNPVTKLWEFYDLRSAFDPARHRDAREIPVPSHREDGSIDVTTTTGVVFVLVPGGMLAMGALAEDSFAMAQELPQHDVPLEPFLLARHELTRAQWCRLARQVDLPLAERGVRTDAATFTYEIGRHDEPAMVEPIDGRYPAESISWIACEAVLRRAGMGMPTEAQWEWGCRAGTTTPWWNGDKLRSLEGAVNLLDARADKYSDWTGESVPWDDGWLLMAPVGALRPNPFGLYHVHGNAAEWCADAYGLYSAEPPGMGDGLRRRGDGSGRKPWRGGSFYDSARLTRATVRGSLGPSVFQRNLGVRPARRLIASS